MNKDEINNLQEKYYLLNLYASIRKKYERVKKLSASDCDVMEEIILTYPEECQKIDNDDNQIKFNEGFLSAIKYIREYKRE